MGKLRGQCLCEKVVFEISGKLGPIYHCHCSKCRRFHGAAFRTRASIERSQFMWIQGEDNLTDYVSSDNVTKSFCKTCGSPMFSCYKNKPGVMGIPLGGLEGDMERGPEAHIFTASKANWYKITDDLPQYGSWPGNEARVRRTSGSNRSSGSSESHEAYGPCGSKEADESSA